MSGRTQNEVIEVLGKHIILRGIVENIRKASFYSILADEVTSHNSEHLVSVPGMSMRKVKFERNFLRSLLLHIPLESSLLEPSSSSWRKTTMQLPTCVVKAMMGLATCHLIVLVSKNRSVK